MNATMKTLVASALTISVIAGSTVTASAYNGRVIVGEDGNGATAGYVAPRERKVVFDTSTQRIVFDTSTQR